MNHKAIFLDRDDTIIEDPGYINNPDQVKLIPGAAGALADLRKMAYKIIIVSNQSGIARGIITEQALAQIHERLKQLLAQQSAYLDRIYYCPFHPDGVIQKFRKDSDLRKPKPGMLLMASREMNIDLKNSWMIGNNYKDVTAGRAADCRTILIKSHTNRPVKQLSDPDADFEAINLKEAVNIIKREIMPKQNIETARSEFVEPVYVEPAPAAAENSKTIEEPLQPQPVEIQAQQQEIQQSDIEPVQQVFENEIIETVVQKPQQPVPPPSSASDGSRTERLLEEIKLLLQSRHRQNMYSDFSSLKLIAGILQIVVLFCLVISLWFSLSPTGKESAGFTALGFAAVFQLMALTLYIMHNEK
ncbi:MAG: HAD family hydrolase [Sedimentisphaerales bacterium]